MAESRAFVLVFVAAVLLACVAALPSGFQKVTLGDPPNLNGQILDMVFLPNGFALLVGKTGKIIISDLSGSSLGASNTYLDMSSATFTYGALRPLALSLCYFLHA
jgi:hypothetical protein